MNSQNSFLRNVICLLQPYTKQIVLVCILMTAGATVNVMIPIVNMKIIDLGIAAQNFFALLCLCGTMLAIHITLRLLDFIEFKRILQIKKETEMDLHTQAQKHLLRLPMEYFKNANEAQIMNNINYDITQLARVTDKSMFASVTQLLNMAGGVVGLCVIDARLLIVFIIAVPIKVLAMRYFSRRREGLFTALLPLLSKLGLWWGDTVSNIETIKLWNMFPLKIAEFKKLKEESIIAEIKTQHNDKFSDNVEYGIDCILKLLMYVFAFWEIANGEMTIGGLIALMSYSSQIISPISFITKIRYYFSDIKPSMARYLEFIELPEEGKRTGTSKMNVFCPKRICFSDVSVEFQGKKILSNITLEFHKGEKVAIVGENGSGKSTLTNLLLRLCEPTNGRISFDGVDISLFDLDEYRELFATVMQTTKLFNTSIRSNIDPFGIIEIEDIMRICRAWGYENLIGSLPDHLDTIVGTNGSKLSGGERQKIGAIRAVLKSAKILIIDEATSNYDYESEEMFDDLVCNCDGYDFVIIITHRPKILTTVDRIIHLEKGQIKGTTVPVQQI